MEKIGIEIPIPQETIKVARSVRRWVLKHNGNSGGMCYDASLEILARIGWPTKIIRGWFQTDEREMFHYWIEIGKNILDVTADQFNYLLEKTKMRSIVFAKINSLTNFYKYKC